MSDDELRALERRVDQEGAADDRLRLAAALGRLGRDEEALAALVPARDHAEARAPLAAHPSSWARGASRSVDVPLLTERPSLLWSYAPEGGSTRLRATLLGAAFDHDTESDGQWTQVVDVVSGAARLQLPPDLEECVGDVALCSDTDGLSAFDLWTGEELWSAGLRARWRATPEGLIAWLRSDVVFYPSAGLRDPLGERRDVARLPGADLASVEPIRSGLWLCEVGQGWPERWFTVDPRTGATRAQGEGGIAVDRAGSVSFEWERGTTSHTVIVRDTEDRVLWAAEGHAPVLAPDGRAVFYQRFARGSQSRRQELFVADRWTGASTALDVEPRAARLIVRGGIYYQDGDAVVAMGSDGVRRWRAELPGAERDAVDDDEGRWRLELVALHGVLLGIHRNQTVFAFGRS